MQDEKELIINAFWCLAENNIEKCGCDESYINLSGTRIEVAEYRKPHKQKRWFKTTITYEDNFYIEISIEGKYRTTIYKNQEPKLYKEQEDKIKEFAVRKKKLDQEKRIETLMNMCK
jgi:hypothetical protein